MAQKRLVGLYLYYLSLNWIDVDNAGEHLGRIKRQIKRQNFFLSKFTKFKPLKTAKLIRALRHGTFTSTQLINRGKLETQLLMTAMDIGCFSNAVFMSPRRFRLNNTDLLQHACVTPQGDRKVLLSLLWEEGLRIKPPGI